MPAARKRALRRDEAIPIGRSGDASVGEQVVEDLTQRAGAEAADPAQGATRERRGRRSQRVLDAHAEREGRRGEDALAAGLAVDDV
jgi:hypothetical protein